MPPSPSDYPAVVKLLTQLADESRADLGDHTGPGSSARFHEAGAKWPLATAPKSERPKKRTQAK